MKNKYARFKYINWNIVLFTDRTPIIYSFIGCHAFFILSAFFFHISPLLYFLFTFFPHAFIAKRSFVHL